jgi:transcriptional regulator with XRE-family HTH domain
MDMDPGTWSARVAAVVRAEMTAQGRTARELAAHLHVSPPTVGIRLRGLKPFDLAELDRVATWLGTTPTELLARADGAGS